MSGSSDRERLEKRSEGGGWGVVGEAKAPRWETEVMERMRREVVRRNSMPS